MDSRTVNLDGDDKNSIAIQKRLNKVVESGIENDKDTMEALNELSKFFTDNTLISRRNLRSQIEKRSLAINEDFLSAFRQVKETLDTMYEDVLEMNCAATHMSSQLQDTKAQTHELIQHTTKLQSERNKITMKQKITEAFIREFQLNDSEINILRNSSEISIAFFNVLDRVDSITNKCKVLMQSGHETCAMDIQQQMTLYKEAALDKIYRWCQLHCKDIESPEISILLYKSMSKLEDHNILFKYIINEYCTCRRAIMVRLFIDALTSGPNAIESYAYDEKRYVSDMLAWLYQFIPLEKQHLLTLLKLCTSTDKENVMNDALANISEGVCNPLRVRIEKILTSNTSPTSLYTVTTLLRFYKKSISNIIPLSSLDKTLDELVETTEGVFINTLQKLVRFKILEKVEAPRSDLSPSPGVTHLLNLFKEILSVANLCGDEVDKQNDTLKIVNNIIDPLLQTINLSASRLTTVDMSVYLLNSLYIIHTTLINYKYIDQYIERIQAQCDVQMDTLTSEQSSSFVINLNLAPIYTILQEMNSKMVEPLSKIQGMEIENLNIFLSKFDNFLNNSNVLVLPQINLILNCQHRNVILNRSVQVICAIYKQLYDAVHDQTNLYINPTSVMKKTPDEIRQILNENQDKLQSSGIQATTSASVVQEI